MHTVFSSCVIPSIVHHLFTEEFSGHPIQPQDFSCATLACDVLNSCRAATPSLGRSSHSLTALTNIFQNSPLANETANIQRKGQSTKCAVHSDGRTKNQGSQMEKTTWFVPVQAMCICCPCGALHPFQPLLPFLLWFTCMWFSTGEIIF